MTEEVSNAVNALVNCNKATSILFIYFCLVYEFWRANLDYIKKWGRFKWNL